MPTPSPQLVAPTLVDALAALRAQEQRGFVFVREGGAEHATTFAELALAAEKRASALRARGLEKGDRVAIAIPDPEEFVLSFLGAVMGGIVPVPISPQLTFKNIDAYHDTVSHIVQASGASMLLTSEGTRGYVEPVAQRVSLARGIVSVDGIAEEAAKASPFRETASPDDLAFLQFTSGSTSRPKGVMVTHANLAWNSQSFMIHGLEKDSSFDKGVSWLPLFHDMGLIGFVIGPIFTDIPVVFLPTASFVRNPKIWLDKIHAHRGTITYAPNFAYQLVTKRVKEKDLAGLDLSCLRRAGCGAEPIQARTLRAFADKLAPAGLDPRAFLPSYGMAEATLAVTFVPAFTGMRADAVDKEALTTGEAKPLATSEHELVDCGRAFPEHEVAIVDEAGNRLPDRRIGEIVTRGPSISRGYYAEEELTKATFRKGPGGAVWLHTGDLGYMVSGSLYVCGRVKDLVIIRGKNYYPSDIEWTVSEIPGVRRGNVVAFGCDMNGEEHLVVAAEALSSEAEALAGVIHRAVLEAFGLSAHEIVMVSQGTLPRTSSGKPQRRKTKQMYEAGTLVRARAVHTDGVEPQETGASA